MGAFLKVTDSILFLFFMLFAIGAPTIDIQTILPCDLYPDVLVELRQWYIREFDYYLLIEKPSFFVGIIWLIVLFVWPLSLFNLYGLLGNKSWFPTTCLISGVSVFIVLAIISFEIIGSGKASNKLIMMYFSFMGLAILATLRGLVLHSNKTVSGIDRPTIPGKKTA